MHKMLIFIFPRRGLCLKLLAVNHINNDNDDSTWSAKWAFACAKHKIFFVCNDLRAEFFYFFAQGRIFEWKFFLYVLSQKLITPFFKLTTPLFQTHHPPLSNSPPPFSDIHKTHHLHFNFFKFYKKIFFLKNKVLNAQTLFHT
jgi:hypothetical protein